MPTTSNNGKRPGGLGGRVRLETRDLASLKPAPYNPRSISPNALAGLSASVRRFGLVQPVIVNERTGNVVGGHQRLKVLEADGVTETDVLVVDLPESEEKALNLALNSQSISGEWTAEALPLIQTVLDDLPDLSRELLLPELKVDLWAQFPPPVPEIEEDEVPPVPEDPETEPGDLYVLGRHRLLCGDATEPLTWSRLEITGDGVMCFTSPPYNLGGSSRLSGNRAQEARGNTYTAHDDALPQDEWRGIVDAMLACALDRCDVAVFNVQPLAGNKRAIWHWVADWSDHLHDVVVWDKGHAAPQMASGVMSSTYELLCVFGDKGASRRIPLASWKGKVQSVYRGPKQTSNEYASVHGATFPVHLPAWVMTDLCNTSRAVVDCCMGTGTTMVAAEHLGRIAYGIEIDPAYCDVIVARWEALTGKKAERVRA